MYLLPFHICLSSICNLPTIASLFPLLSHYLLLSCYLSLSMSSSPSIPSSPGNTVTCVKKWEFHGMKFWGTFHSLHTVVTAMTTQSSHNEWQCPFLKHLSPAQTQRRATLLQWWATLLSAGLKQSQQLKNENQRPESNCEKNVGSYSSLFHLSQFDVCFSSVSASRTWASWYVHFSLEIRDAVSTCDRCLTQCLCSKQKSVILCIIWEKTIHFIPTVLIKWLFPK